MKRTDLKYEEKPIYEPGQEVICEFEGMKRATIYSANQCETKISKEYLPDWDNKDTIIYSLIIDGMGGPFTGYYWWDLRNA